MHRGLSRLRPVKLHKERAQIPAASRDPIAYAPRGVIWSRERARAQRSEPRQLWRPFARSDRESGVPHPDGRAHLAPSITRRFRVGSIKGKGNSAANSRRLKVSSGYRGVTPGLIYRTSPISAIGFMLPFSYRLINWKLENGTSFNPDGDSSFSVGVQGVYINQLTRNNYLNLSSPTRFSGPRICGTWSWQYMFY